MKLKAKFKQDGKMFTVSNKKLNIVASDKTLKKAIAVFIDTLEEKIANAYETHPSKINYKFEQVGEKEIEIEMEMALLKSFIQGK